MKLNRTKVLCTAIGAIIAAFVLSAGPHATNVAMELSIFDSKCAMVLFFLYACMENEK